MFTLVRRCAELITQPCWLKVKVTVQGHGFELWISCPLCISFSPGRIFSKLWSNVHLSGTMCRIHNSAQRTRSRLQLKVTSLSLEFGVSSISPLPLEGFSLNVGQMFASVRWCAEPITQLCWLKVKVTLEGHPFEPWIWGHSIAIQTALLNLGQMFTLVRWCVEPITQWCRLKVKVTIEGHPSLSCLLHISWTLWKTSMKLWSNVCLSEAMCRTHNSSILTQGQGHS